VTIIAATKRYLRQALKLLSGWLTFWGFPVSVPQSELNVIQIFTHKLLYKNIILTNCERNRCMPNSSFC